MKRTVVNLLIDSVAALLFLCMAATGYVLYFPLPPGTNRSLMLWGMTRHQWGTVHFWLGVSLVGVLLLHVCLHWQWVISSILRQVACATRTRGHPLIAGLGTAAVLLAGFGFFALATHQGVQDARDRPDVCPPPVEVPQTARPRTDRVDFWKDVYPVFERSCLSCHGPVRQRASFRIDRREDVLGGKSPLIVPGKSSESRLIAIVSGQAPGMVLAARHQLPEAEVQQLKKWVDEGARWPNPPASR
jgi:Domain of unknown function (DUF4405)/Planctomycete cytochrome C